MARKEANSKGQKEQMVLIDGNAILHRAYHALPPLTNRSGELVNAVYGFSSMLLKILTELKPKCLAVSFDTSKPVFRHQEFIGYKANRPRMDSELVGQIEKVKEVVRAFNIPIYEIDGYEADDVIGSIAREVTQETQLEVVIVTGDKDFMQLVNPKIKLYMPVRGLSEAQIIGPKEVEEKMGLPPEKIVDYKGLVGDPSDNYPGVPGIGPKTATKLLQKFGSLEEIYQHLGEVEGKSLVKKLAEGAESAVLSKKLARILTDAPLSLEMERCQMSDFDREKVIALFQQLGFKSLIARLGGEEEKKAKKKKTEPKAQQSLF